MDGFAGAFQLLLREGDFFGADVVVEFLEVDEALEVGAERFGSSGGGGDLEALNVFRGEVGGSFEHRFQDGGVEAGFFEEAVQVGVFGEVGDFVGGAFVGEVVAAEVDEDADGCGCEELIHVPAFIGDGFEDEDDFEKDVGFFAGERAEGGGAGGRIDEEVDRVLHERVIGGDEADVFADGGALAFEGGEEAVGGDGWEAFDVSVARIEEDVAFLVVFDADAEVVEQCDEEAAEERIGVGGADAVDDSAGFFGVEGVELEEAVAAFLHFLRELFSEGICFGDERLECVGRFFLGAVRECDGEETVAEFFAELGAAVDRGFEGVEAAVVPFEDGFVGGAFHVGNVDADGLGLADAVEAADALLD